MEGSASIIIVIVLLWAFRKPIFSIAGVFDSSITEGSHISGEILTSKFKKAHIEVLKENKKTKKQLDKLGDVSQFTNKALSKQIRGKIKQTKPEPEA